MSEPAGEHFDLIVIGGGGTGREAATRAAVDQWRLGGRDRERALGRILRQRGLQADEAVR